MSLSCHILRLHQRALGISGKDASGNIPLSTCRCVSLVIMQLARLGVSEYFSIVVARARLNMESQFFYASCRVPSPRGLSKRDGSVFVCPRDV